MPELDRINGFVEVSATDGCSVSIEIATRKVYRCYGYANPDFYVQRHWQAKNIVDILRLVNKEFRLKNKWPSDKSLIAEDTTTAEVVPKK